MCVYFNNIMQLVCMFLCLSVSTYVALIHTTWTQFHDLNSVTLVFAHSAILTVTFAAIFGVHNSRTNTLQRSLSVCLCVCLCVCMS